MKNAGIGFAAFTVAALFMLALLAGVADNSYAFDPEDSTSAWTAADSTSPGIAAGSAKSEMALLLDKAGAVLGALVSAIRPQAYYPVSQYEDYRLSFTGEEPGRTPGNYSLCVIANPFVQYPANAQLVTMIDTQTSKSYIGLHFSF